MRDVIAWAALTLPLALEPTNDLALGASVAVNVALVLLSLWRERKLANLEGRVDALTSMVSGRPGASVSPIGEPHDGR